MSAAKWFFKHFSPKEFHCKCMGRYKECKEFHESRNGHVVFYELVFALETLRSLVDRPLTIVSGQRCIGYNNEVDGAPRSMHLFGAAADVWTGSKKESDRFAEQAEKIYAFHIGGIIRYQTFVHVDIRWILGKSPWKACQYPSDPAP